MSAEKIRRTLDLFVEPGGVCELRVLGGSVRPNGGFFDDLDRMAEVAHMFDKGGQQDGLFFTLNPINRALLARYNNKMCQGKKPELTKGPDVLKRRWLYVDIDVKGKISGISSRDSEHEEALKAAIDLRDKMVKQAGWPMPVYCDSGNGAHLQYRIDLPNNEDSTALVKRTLQCLNRMFNHPTLEVDESTHDPNRIAKLYGTMVKKGEEIEDRHHRRSHIIEVPEQLIPITKEQLIEFVSHYEMEPELVPAYRGNGAETIPDMPAWLKAHNLPWKNTKPGKNGGTWYQLEECPSCHNSDGNACAVVKFPGAGQEAMCYHRSCKIKRWEDFVRIVDPAYYEARQQSRQERDQNRRGRDELPELCIEDLCREKTINEGKENERIEHTFSPELAADSIIQRFDILTTEDGTIWVYRNGYYSKDWWQGITDMVNNVAGDHFPTKMKKELESKVQSKTRASEELFYGHPYLLCCKNVTVDLLTGEILPHSPEHYINSPSAFFWDPKAWPDAFIQLLEESCSNDIDRMTLIDWIVATCCLVEFEFILFMTGNGSNGKRMYEDVLKAIFPGFTEHIGLEEINKSKFAKAQLKVARTNVFNETNVDRAGTETIKSLSGGDEQSGDVKNQKNRDKWRSFTQLIFDTNGMPRFNDTSYGFKRRFTRVKMIFTFVDNPDPTNPLEKKADPTLGERLVSEENLSGILNLVIARAKEIAKARKICRRDDDFDEYEEDTHSFNNFI